MRLALFTVVYNLLFPLAFVLYLPAFIAKLVRRGGCRDGFGERFGWFGAAKKRQLQALAAPVWIHAVSVGEVNAALTFLRRWQARDSAQTFVLSTTTNTGQKVAREKAPPGVVVIYCPIDFIFCVAAALRRIRPRLLIIFEVEIWPTMIALATARGVPVALANGRMSDRSAAGYRRWRRLFAPIFARIRPFCVQSPEDARRVEAVVGSHAALHVCNTMKFDQVPDLRADAQASVLEAAFGAGERLVFTAASTHPGEEEIVLRVFREVVADYPRTRLVLAPRHAERAAGIRRLVEDAALSCRLLTEARADRTPDAHGGPAEVLLVDTTGDLMNLMAVSDIVYVGKSLGGNIGGHNIIEPAIFGKAIVYGPHMENFRLVADLFRERDATVEVADEAALTAAVRRLLGASAERQRLAAASRQTVEAHRGAVDRTVELMLQRLDS